MRGLAAPAARRHRPATIRRMKDLTDIQAARFDDLARPYLAHPAVQRMGGFIQHATSRPPRGRCAFGWSHAARETRPGGRRPAATLAFGPAQRRLRGRKRRARLRRQRRRALDRAHPHVAPAAHARARQPRGPAREPGRQVLLPLRDALPARWQAARLARASAQGPRMTFSSYVVLFTLCSFAGWVYERSSIP